jgi:Protein of unknown function (DUF4238)
MWWVEYSKASVKYKTIQKVRQNFRILQRWRQALGDNSILKMWNSNIKKQMKSPKQDQHKIPQVYLKKFGYRDINNQWKISVISRDESFTRQKSIESFYAVTNVFDINSDDPRIPRMFEQLNCDLETEYNNILKELEDNGMLSDKSYAYLLQLIANLIVRADHWRDWILGMLAHENKENFLQIIMGHHCKDYVDFQNIRQQPFFRILADSEPTEVVNRVLLYFIDHLMKRLWNYEITFIQSQDEKPWFTSTNPVVVHNRTKHIEIFAKESEIYFPLSPKFLAYLHFKGSDDKVNLLRTLTTNKIHLANDEQNVELQNTIMANPSAFLLIAGEFKYRRFEKTNSTLQTDHLRTDSKPAANMGLWQVGADGSN